MRLSIQDGEATSSFSADISAAMTSSRRLLPFHPQTAELELLLCCARCRLDADRSARMGELLEQRIDWDVLLSLANAHGLSPLLYWHLSKNFSQLLPSAVAEALHDQFQRNVQRNLFLTWELVNVLKLLAARNISVVPFKGPTLAEALYGNIALRQCSDLDIFIRSNDLAAGIETLVSEGYSPVLQLSVPQRAALIRTHYEYGLFSPSGTLIEFQWAIVPRYFSLPLGTEQLWHDLGTIRIAGAEAVALPPENLLLILCIHGGKHLWNRLVWLSDISELIQLRAGLDWEYVLRQARGVGAERMLRLGLSLAHTIFGTALPEDIHVRIAQDKTALDLNRQVCQMLASSSETGDFAAHVFLIRTRERCIDKARYALRFVFTPATVEWSLIRLPKVLFPLYSALRLARGVLKAGILARRWVRKHAGRETARNGG